MKQWEVSDGADGAGEEFCLQSSVQTRNICRGGNWGTAHLASCSAKPAQTWDQLFFSNPEPMFSMCLHPDLSWGMPITER